MTLNTVALVYSYAKEGKTRKGSLQNSILQRENVNTMEWSALAKNSDV